MIPQHPNIRRYFAQPTALHVEAKADIKAWLVGRGSIFVVMRTYHKGYPHHPTTQVMYFRRFGSCPQVLARWSGPEKANFLEDTKATYKQCGSTDYDWPTLGLPVILNQEQLLKVQGRWMQPLRKKEGKRTTKKEYLKVKRVTVSRNDNVNINAEFPGCEVLNVKLVEITRHDGRAHPCMEQRIKMNLREARTYKNCGVEFYATVNKSSVRFRQALGQWRISFSSEDRDIKSFTVMVTIKKEPTDGNV